jgi:uncharacterized coiled-coil protein SlyX
MINLERVNKESELTVLENRVVGQRLRAEKLRNTLRLLIDPTKAVESLNREDIFSLALEFSAAHQELEKTLAHIDTIKAFLGR